MKSNTQILMEEWCQVAVGNKPACAIVGSVTPTEADMLRLQEAYDCCARTINSTKKICQQVNMRPMAHNSSAPSLVANARQAVNQLQNGALAEVSDMQWQDKTTITIENLKNTLKKCAEELSAVALLEKELKALVHIKV